MISVAEVVTDPDFASTYQVVRSQGRWIDGVFVLSETETLRFYGVVQPTTPKELEQIPEGERPNGAISFHARKRFFLTAQGEDGEGDYLSDEILWHGDRYKILQVKDWSAHGYWKAIATLM